MKIKGTILLLCFLSGISAAVTFEQTDWSGRSGIFGPVAEWSDDYCICSCVDCDSESGVVIFSPVYYETHSIAAGYYGVRDIVSADIDNDGDMDIASVTGGGYLMWWENGLNEGADWIGHSVASGLHQSLRICAGDIDGDHDIDLASSSVNCDFISWFENDSSDGLSWTHHYVATDVEYPGDIQIVDMDNDGDMDVLAALQGDHAVTYYENLDSSSGTHWASHLVYSCHIPTCIQAFDADSDGDMDVVGGYKYSYYSYLFYCINTDSGWEGHLISSSVDEPEDVCAGDMDGDGDLDFVWAGYDDDQVMWHENRLDQQETWLQHPITETLDGACDVDVFDMDCDGDMDVLASGAWENEVKVWENLSGDGTEWESSLVVSGYLNSCAAIATDLDEDQAPEIVAISYGNHVMDWFEQVEDQSQGYLESSVLYLHCDPSWELFDCSVSAVNESCVRFQVRASDDISQMGPWSDEHVAPFCMDTLLSPDHSYFQYRVVLEMDSSAAEAPVLYGISASWDPVGINSSHAPLSGCGATVQLVQNPVCQSTVNLRLAYQAQPVQAHLFDTAGRKLGTFSESCSPSGICSIEITDLSPGVYFLVVSGVDSEESVLKFAVLD